MKTSTFTILYKNATGRVMFDGTTSKNTDPRVYTVEIVAKDEKSARKMFAESRVSFVTNAKGKKVKVVAPFTIVRITTGDPLMFKNFRGKFERKYVTVLPSKMPRYMR